jgi:nucleoside-diphosphate-sugar epimerase
MSYRVLMVGFGKLPSKVVTRLLSSGDLGCRLKCDVLKQSVLREKPDGVNQVYLGSVDEAKTWAQLPHSYDALLYCLSPGGRTQADYVKVFEQGIRACLEHFNAAAKAPHIIFVSSTSVYGQDDGEWVDEVSPTQPSSVTAQSLVAAEHALALSGLEHTVVRFSGIYGGGRTRMLEQVMDQAPLLAQEPRLSNRIHEADCVGFLSFLLAQLAEQSSIEACYVASDSDPCDLNEVYQFIADRMSLTLSFAAANTVTRRGGNKRCDNKLMKSSGYELQYPSYKDGYAEMIEKLAAKQGLR